MGDWGLVKRPIGTTDGGLGTVNSQGLGVVSYSVIRLSYDVANIILYERNVANQTSTSLRYQYY